MCTKQQNKATQIPTIDMLELSYKYNEDSGCAVMLVNGEELTQYYCDEDPDEVFKEFANTFFAAQEHIGAAAVMGFVNTLIGAFESGFTSTNSASLFQLYRCAQNHVKDNYSVDVKNIDEVWGEDTANDCRNLHNV